jgi:hypothetical protein
VPSEAPFLFSVAALSASLAGLAGLVAALRRGHELQPMELYRLREIVEFAFANVLISLSFVALATFVGTTTAARIAGAGILVYLVVITAALTARLRKAGLAQRRPWLVAVAALDLVGVVLAVLTLVTGHMAALEMLLIVLLARPMVSFLFVLAGLESTDPV